MEPPKTWEADDAYASEQDGLYEMLNWNLNTEPKRYASPPKERAQREPNQEQARRGTVDKKANWRGRRRAEHVRLLDFRCAAWGGINVSS